MTIKDETTTELLDVSELVPSLDSLIKLADAVEQINNETHTTTQKVLSDIRDGFKQNITNKVNLHAGAITAEDKQKLKEQIFNTIDALTVVDTFLEQLSSNSVIVQIPTERNGVSKTVISQQTEHGNFGPIGANLINQINIESNSKNTNDITFRLSENRNGVDIAIASLQITYEDNLLQVKLKLSETEDDATTINIPSSKTDNQTNVIKCIKLGIDTSIANNQYAQLNNISKQNLESSIETAKNELSTNDPKSAELNTIETQLDNINAYITKNFDNDFLNIAAEAILLHDLTNTNKENLTPQEIVLNWLIGTEQHPLAANALTKNKTNIFLLQNACEMLETTPGMLVYPEDTDSKLQQLAKSIKELAQIKLQRLQQEDSTSEHSLVDFESVYKLSQFNNDKRVLTLITLRNLLQ